MAGPKTKLERDLEFILSEVLRRSVEPLFLPEARMVATLICRTDDPEKEVVVTADDLDQVLAAVQRAKMREEGDDERGNPGFSG